MKIKTSKKSKKTFVFSLISLLLIITLTIPLILKSPKAKDTTAEIQEQTIKFSIDNEEFSANREMTWEDWIESEYNTEEYSIDENNFICNENGKLTRNSKLIMKNYYVIENAEYDFVINTYIVNIEYENTTLSYVFEQDMTWDEWLNSDYANDSVFSESAGATIGDGISTNVGTLFEPIIYILCDTTLNSVVLKNDTINSNHIYDLLLNITFEIDNTVYGCFNGMTWAEFIANNNDFSIDNDGHIAYGSGLISYNNVYVLSTDTIVANREYETVIPMPAPTLITFTISNIQYQAESGMTWADWVDSEYNTDNYFISDNYIIDNIEGLAVSMDVTLSGPVNLTQSLNVQKNDLIIENVSYHLVGIYNGSN